MKIYLVGGAVRDKLLGREVKERDYVVVGGTVGEMLKRGYRQVGKEFPVFLHPETSEEYALARMERKIKPGYTGFSFDTSPTVTLEDDLMRRDLTINAMAETLEGELIDPYQGKRDIEAKLLRHVSPAFAEDPVRILRVGRFLARYAQLGFHVSPATIELMRHMVSLGEVNALVAERVWKELERALGEPNPEKFFEVLSVSGALTILFPHLLSNGPGMAALKEAVKLTASPLIRFAALLYALPEDSTDKSQAKKILNALCHRYRVPNQYKELASLTLLHWQEAATLNHDNVDELADKLLSLFAKLDIYRRWERFAHFLIACQAISKALGVELGVDVLRGAGEVAKEVRWEEIKADEIGAEIKIKMDRFRSEKIREFLLRQPKSE